MLCESIVSILRYRHLVPYGGITSSLVTRCNNSPWSSMSMFTDQEKSSWNLASRLWLQFIFHLPVETQLTLLPVCGPSHLIADSQCLTELHSRCYFGLGHFSAKMERGTETLNLNSFLNNSKWLLSTEKAEVCIIRTIVSLGVLSWVLWCVFALTITGQSGPQFPDTPSV